METGQPPANDAPARNGPLLVFLLLITAILIITHNARESASGRHWDFQAFYLGAEMVSHGEGSRLYDFNDQAAAQMRYVDPTRQVALPDMPFLNPAATTLLLLPFAKFSMAAAYAAWTVINVLILVMAVRLLQKVLPLPHDNRPLLAAILFYPAFDCLLRGQVSILILFFVALAFYFLIRSRSLLAGFVLGLRRRDQTRRPDTKNSRRGCAPSLRTIGCPFQTWRRSIVLPKSSRGHERRQSLDALLKTALRRGPRRIIPLHTTYI